MIWNYFSNKNRLRPTFLIIGAQRAGTTALYHHLILHPQITAAKRKEIHFFDSYYEKGLKWYLGNFKQPFWSRKDIVTGEATPYYLFHPLVAYRVKKDFPDMKLIVLLRDPAERAYSHYKLNRSKGIEDLTFSEAVERENERIVFENEVTVNYQHYSYLKRGIYIDQIREWMHHFRREQIVFVKSESFFSNPQPIFDKLFEFLNVKPFKIKQFLKMNESEPLPLDRELKRELNLYFASSNQALANLLGEEFTWNNDENEFIS